MAFELPLLTDQGDVAIATKIPNALNALRNGNASMYTQFALNAVAGTADAITLTTDPAGTPHTVLQEGHRLRVRPKFTNTGAMTCALDGQPAKPIKKRQSGTLVAVAAGDVVVDVPIDLVFDVISQAFVLETVTADGIMDRVSVDVAGGTTPIPTTAINVSVGNVLEVSAGLSVTNGATAGIFSGDLNILGTSVVSENISPLVQFPVLASGFIRLSVFGHYTVTTAGTFSAEHSSGAPTGATENYYKITVKRLGK